MDYDVLLQQIEKLIEKLINQMKLKNSIEILSIVFHSECKNMLNQLWTVVSKCNDAKNLKLGFRLCTIAQMHKMKIDNPLVVLLLSLVKLLGCKLFESYDAHECSNYENIQRLLFCGSAGNCILQVAKQKNLDMVVSPRQLEEYGDACVLRSVQLWIEITFSSRMENRMEIQDIQNVSRHMVDVSMMCSEGGLVKMSVPDMKDRLYVAETGSMQLEKSSRMKVINECLRWYDTLKNEPESNYAARKMVLKSCIQFIGRNKADMEVGENRRLREECAIRLVALFANEKGKSHKAIKLARECKTPTARLFYVMMVAQVHEKCAVDDIQATFNNLLLLKSYSDTLMAVQLLWKYKMDNKAKCLNQMVLAFPDRKVQIKIHMIRFALRDQTFKQLSLRLFNELVHANLKSADSKVRNDLKQFLLEIVHDQAQTNRIESALTWASRLLALNRQDFNMSPAEVVKLKCMMSWLHVRNNNVQEAANVVVEARKEHVQSMACWFAEFCIRMHNATDQTFANVQANVKTILREASACFDFQLTSYASFLSIAEQYQQPRVSLIILEELCKTEMLNIEKIQKSPATPLGLALQNAAHLSVQYPEIATRTFFDYARDMLSLCQFVQSLDNGALAMRSIGPLNLLHWFYTQLHQMGVEQQNKEAFLIARSLARMGYTFGFRVQHFQMLETCSQLQILSMELIPWSTFTVEQSLDAIKRITEILAKMDSLPVSSEICFHQCSFAVHRMLLHAKLGNADMLIAALANDVNLQGYPISYFVVAGIFHTYLFFFT